MAFTNREENDSYLRIISDVPTRWNSSYLAWIRLLKIQNLIDIMASSLSVNSNLQARKDGKRLKEINLVDEEWKPLRKLTNILKKFAEATEVLTLLLVLYIKLYKSKKKCQNALYKTMNHYWNVPNDYAMIGILLDPRYKELQFASDHLKVQIQKKLRSIYENYIDQEDDDYNNKDND
ncbi:4086_t:CDS:2 [Rhizophagus irregularis]|nr:4086_t:CDS:2 [Rhizophagus irregularis]